jgi:hypothetical protein
MWLVKIALILGRYLLIILRSCWLWLVMRWVLRAWVVAVIVAVGVPVSCRATQVGDVMRGGGVCCGVGLLVGVGLPGLLTQVRPGGLSVRLFTSRVRLISLLNSGWPGRHSCQFCLA